MNGAEYPSQGLDSIADWSQRMQRSYYRAKTKKKAHSENNPPSERSSSASLPTMKKPIQARTDLHSAPVRQRGEEEDGHKRRKKFPCGGPVGRAGACLGLECPSPREERGSEDGRGSECVGEGSGRSDAHEHSPRGKRERGGGDWRGSRTQNRQVAEVGACPSRATRGGSAWPLQHGPRGPEQSSTRVVAVGLGPLSCLLRFSSKVSLLSFLALFSLHLSLSSPHLDLSNRAGGQMVS